MALVNREIIDKLFLYIFGLFLVVFYLRRKGTTELSNSMFAKELDDSNSKYLFLY